MPEIWYGASRAREALYRAEEALQAYQQSADIDQYRLRNLHTARDLAAARLEMVLADDAKDAAARAADRQQRNPKPPASDR